MRYQYGFSQRDRLGGAVRREISASYGVDPSPAMVKAAFLPVAHDLAGNPVQLILLTH